MTIFWAFALGQVVGYLGSALSNQTYNFTLTTIFSLIVGLFIIVLGHVSTPKEQNV